jgi:hypothetical protein
MASTSEVGGLPTEKCPDCGSGFARDLAGTGYRRHLEALPKRDRKTKEIIKDDQGIPAMCGGSAQSWGKGKRS